MQPVWPWGQPWIKVLLRCRRRWIIATLCSLGIIGIPTVALANSPPPPQLTWLTFKAMPAALESVQLIGCDGETCQVPEVLAQYGACTLDQCLPQPQPRSDLICRGQTCLEPEGLTLNTQDGADPHLQVIVQADNRIWISNVSPVTEDSALGGWGSQYWWVTTTDSGLVLEPDLAGTSRGSGRSFIQGFLLTLITEALVLGGLLWQLKCDRTLWVRTFTSFGLMHLVTYPIVWNFTLALVPFQVVISRIVGFICVAIALLYAATLYPVRRAKTWKLMVGTGLLLPFGFFLGLMIAFLIGYGKYIPSVIGIPHTLALGISEVLITGYEAGFLAMLSQGELSLKRAGQFSLWMNSFSLLAGLLVRHIWL